MKSWLWVVFLLGLAHAGAYALLVPPWQAPDEPGHWEYACLMGRLGRVPQAEERSPELQAEIIASLARHQFWPRVREVQPEPLPTSFAADPFLARSGRQVGDEPPLYYLVPALICRVPLAIETRLRLTRLYGALLFGLTAAVVLWGWEAEREEQGSVTTRIGRPNSRSTTDFWPLPLWQALVVALLPMPAFIAGSVNNDGLAILTASAVFAAVLRLQRHGWRWRRAAGLIALLALALTSKKTNLFLGFWVGLLANAGGWRLLQERYAGRKLAQWRLPGIMTIAAVAVGLLLLLPSAAPSGWRGRGQPPGRGRTALTASDGRWSVRVVDRSRRSYGRLLQNVVGPRIEELRGRQLRASAMVRSATDGLQPGRLTVRDRGGYTQVQFVAGQEWQRIELTHTVALTTTYVKLALAPGPGHSEAETGQLLVDAVSLIGPDGTNLLRNSSFELPARWGELLLLAPVEERWQQFAPRLSREALWAPEAVRRYALYVALLFPGFWGNFGWLQLPLPIWIYGLLAAICLAAIAGLWRLCREQRCSGAVQIAGQRSVSLMLIKLWLLAVALIALQTLLPMLGRAWQPQGRYLFPALVPISGLLLLGLDSWLNLAHYPNRGRFIIGFLIILDLYCLLGVIVPTYYWR